MNFIFDINIQVLNESNCSEQTGLDFAQQGENRLSPSMAKSDGALDAYEGENEMPDCRKKVQVLLKLLAYCCLWEQYFL